MTPQLTRASTEQKGQVIMEVNEHTDVKEKDSREGRDLYMVSFEPWARVMMLYNVPSMDDDNNRKATLEVCLRTLRQRKIELELTRCEWRRYLENLRFCALPYIPLEMTFQLDWAQYSVLFKGNSKDPGNEQYKQGLPLIYRQKRC
jgi:hypothetical protein